jgi:hypothetical protein
MGIEARMVRNMGKGNMGRMPQHVQSVWGMFPDYLKHPLNISIVTNEETMPGDIKWDMQHYLYSPSPSPPLLFPHS